MSDTLSARQWRCAICGYVHVGREAPDCCPVCGTGPDDFEAYEASVPTPASPAVATRWQSLACNYIHEGAETPAPAKRAIESGSDFSLLLPPSDCSAVADLLRHH